MKTDIKLVVAVTDSIWLERLRRQPGLYEINFWLPNPRNFRALQPGELFLFKQRAPHNVIVGGGVFAHFNIVPCSLAWEAFQEANGADSLQEMRKLIMSYRDTESDDRSDFKIGCRILTQPFFFEEHDFIPIPTSWSPNIVSFKTYTTADAEGLELWEAVGDRLNSSHRYGAVQDQARFGKPSIIRPRLGQGAFRFLVTDIYQRRCAVTGESTLPALEAAHILPYGEGGTHEPSNGLLLRRDIHSLFDTGYVTVTPSFHFEVSSSIKEEYENGRDYYALHGHPIRLPEDSSCRPHREALNWHNEHCFRQ